MVLVCCPLQKKLESKVWRRYYSTFYLQRKPLVESGDLVKASVGSTEENSCWNEWYSSERTKRWSTQSLLKEIVNFVFNKNTQETRRTRLSGLILYKKTLRRINPKNWLLNELWHKIPKKGILSFIKVKLTVGGWWYGFVQLSRISLYPSFFFFFFFFFWL